MGHECQTTVPFCVTIIYFQILLLFHGGLCNMMNTRTVLVPTESLHDCGNSGWCAKDQSRCPANTSPSGNPDVPDKAKIISCWYKPVQSVNCTFDPGNNNPHNTNYILIISKEKFNHCIMSDLEFNAYVMALNNVTKSESISDPFKVMKREHEKLPAPTLTEPDTTKTDLVTKLSGVDKGGLSHDHIICRLRYRESSADLWTQVQVNLTDDTITIRNLQPFTQYQVEVSCRKPIQIHWSDWSVTVLGKTLEDAPSKALDIWLTKEAPNSEGRRQVLLRWKVLNDSDSHGKILGYQVHYSNVNDPSSHMEINTTETETEFNVTAVEHEVTVLAFNSVGHSPASSVRIPASQTTDLFLSDHPPVEAAQAFPESGELWVKWEASNGTVSAYVIQWCVDKDPCVVDWQYVSNDTHQTRLSGIERLTCYNISIYPIYEKMPGPPISIQAYLEEGAPGPVPSLRITDVTHNSATVHWGEIMKEERHGFIQNYTVSLECNSRVKLTRTVQSSVLHWKFTALEPNTQYTVSVTASTNGGHSEPSRSTFTSYFDPYIAVPIVLLLLFLGIGIIVLRIFLKKTIFNKVPDPLDSGIGRWLLDFPSEKQETIKTLKLEEDFYTGDLQIENWSVEAEKGKCSLISERLEKTVLNPYVAEPPSSHKTEDERYACPRRDPGPPHAPETDKLSRPSSNTDTQRLDYGPLEPAEQDYVRHTVLETEDDLQPVSEMNGSPLPHFPEESTVSPAVQVLAGPTYVLMPA
ncbi:interleukin-6 receptor subunit beta isoform X1 [Amia ocellicauda]|uniref:interleukin-6 receptor subunit beta isoform X1 n=1 Tax=Amia ocellicauda TaxID=2972642 RepID=UPI0034638F86